MRYCPNGSIKRYKGRLVTQCFAQLHKIDYTEMFVLRIRQKLLSICLAIAVILRMIIMQIDIIDTHLESSLG